MLLPTGFCSAIRLAAFISVIKDKPNAFSLFSCGPQSLEVSAVNVTDDESATQDDLMRMQLKISDSTTGLWDNKDVRKLTLVKQRITRDFHELSRLLENLSGVTALHHKVAGFTPTFFLYAKCIDL